MANGVTCNGRRYVYRCYAKARRQPFTVWIADSLKGLLSDWRSMKGHNFLFGDV
jgi:hypothetical protein